MLVALVDEAVQPRQRTEVLHQRGRWIPLPEGCTEQQMATGRHGAVELHECLIQRANDVLGTDADDHVGVPYVCSVEARLEAKPRADLAFLSPSVGACAQTVVVIDADGLCRRTRIEDAQGELGPSASDVNQ